ncbi:MAG TPA: winged helix-turn-helix domain-containing protein [Ktedonobacteraceae bacterium]
MIKISGCTANKVLAVLIQNGRQTYAQLSRELDISDRNIRQAVDELVEVGLAKKVAGDRRTILVQHSMPIYQEATEARDMCVLADASGDMNEKVRAVRATMKSIFPPDKYPNFRNHARDARELLNLAGNSAVLVHDGVEPAVDHLEEIKSPHYYCKMMLTREGATLARDKAKQTRIQATPEPKEYEQETQAPIITPELMELARRGNEMMKRRREEEAKQGGGQWRLSV